MSHGIHADVRALPPLPENVERIQRVCLDDASEISDVVAAIETDPMTVVNLLKVLNSPFYGLSGRVTQLRQAVSLFGKSMIRGFVVASTLHRNLPLDLSPYGIANGSLLEVSELQRALIHAWIGEAKPSWLGILGPASFMLESGRIVIARHLLERGLARPFREALRSGEAVDTVERNFTGSDSLSIAADVFAHWNFEAGLVETIRNAGDPVGAGPGLREPAWALNAVISCVTLPAGFRESGVAAGRAAAEAAGLDPDRFSATAQRIAGLRGVLVS